ncbi:MAG: hypothetical protein FJX74_09075 [Armatimonadetes bacterium]|nr:hypothetical protein [Armatimonadota bacterium]
MFCALIGVLGATCGGAAQPAAVLIDDFEAGVGGWALNDASAERLGKASLPSIYAVSPGAPESAGKQAALMEFAAGQGTWASISRKVSGEAWLSGGCTGLALRLRGDGSRRSLNLVLRSYVKAGETTTDTSFLKEVWLTTPGWQGLYIPFSAFKTREGVPLDEERLRGVKLLQFVKTGTWEAVRFTVDDVRAEAATRVEPTPPTPEALLLDFDGLSGTSRLRHGVCLGSGWDRVLKEQTFGAQVKGALAALGRPTVRVKLSDFYLPGNLGLRSSDLHRTLSWIRSAGGEPLLCLDVPLAAKGATPETGWRDFGAFCSDLAALRKKEPGARVYEIGNEPLVSGQFRTIEAATDAYNALAAQMLLIDPEAQIGGMGFASPWDEHLDYFIRNARSLSFLSFHFYGAHAPVAGDEDLFEAACRAEARDLPHQLTPAQVRALLDARPGRRAELWITECALNSAREPNGQARDPRLQTPYAAAWVTAFSLACAGDVDRVLWFKAYGNGWGLLADDGSSTPAMQTLAQLAGALPVGAGIGLATHFGKPLFVLPAAAGPARHVIVAHAGGSSTLTLRLTGSPSPQPTRLRRVDATSTGGFVPLTPSTTQKLPLTGPGMAVMDVAAGQ